MKPAPLYSQTDILRECGFSPPATEFVRGDPRGEEYGYYGAIVTTTVEGQVYTINHYDPDNKIEYTLKIVGEKHFRCWASDIF